jgi:Amt family ammonium transporter
LIKIKIDPVGAISVHGVPWLLYCRCFFAIDGGLLYGGGFEKLGVQAIEYFQLRHGQWALLL